MSIPLFLPLAKAVSLSPKEHFCFQHGERFFPVEVHHFSRFGFLLQLTQGNVSNAEQTVAGEVNCPKVFPLDTTLFTDSAVAVVAAYCRLDAKTSHANIPKDVDMFWSQISLSEREFLLETFPGLQPRGASSPASPADVTAQSAASIRYLFEAMKLADYLQCTDLVTLIAGFIALQLRGKDTVGMRQTLGIAASVPEETLFDEETLTVLKAERDCVSASE